MPQVDFGKIAQPLGPDTGGADKPDIGGAEDWTANPKGEGMYSMNTADGGTVRIPYSKVLSAGKSGFKLDPKDYSRFMGDFHFAHKKDKDQPHPEDEFASSGVGETAERKGYGLLHGLTDLLPTIGTIGGAMAAAPLAAAAALPTGGAGTVAAEIGGAGIGAGLGEAIRQKIDDAVWGETTAHPWMGIAEEAGGGALAEVGGRLMGKALAKPIKYFGDTAAKVAQAGFRLLPSEAQGAAANFLERYAKNSLFSSGKMAAFREAQNKETLKAAQDLATSVSSFSGTNADLGKVVNNGIEGFRSRFRVIQKKLYDDIDAKATAAGVAPERKSLVDFAKQEIARIKAAKQGGAAPTSRLLPQLEAIVKDNSKTATYAAMKDARAGWLATSRTMEKGLSGPEKGLVDSIVDRINGSMEDAARKANVPGLINDVRHANALTKDAHERFEDEFMKRVARFAKQPSRIAPLFKLPSTSPEGIATLMRTVGVNERAAIRSHVISDAITQATKEGKIKFNERKFADTILNKIGDAKGEALYGAAHWKDIKGIAEIMQHIVGEVAGRGGGAAELANPAIAKEMFITPVLAMAGFGAANVPGMAATLGAEATGIRAFANALSNPARAEQYLKYLQKGMRIGPYGLQAGINIMGGQRQAAQHERELRQKAETAAAAEPTAGSTEEQTAVADNYSQFAVGQDGHMIGYDGSQWVDLQTGAPVQ